jgi:hypothetical protein
MELLIAASGTAGPVFYIVAGIFLLLVTSFLASNYKGLGAKWIQLALPKRDDLDPRRKRLIKRYRIYYGIAAVLGLLMIISGIARL